MAAIETSVGREAVTVGKPSSWLMQRILQKYGLEARRTVMIGDRLDTDIMLGVNGGTDSILVCTGCTTLPEVARLRRKDPHAPTLVMAHIGLIAEAVAKEEGLS